MVALGRPGRGEELLARCGFVDVQRRTIPFAWEFADPPSFARALASTGPAYEAIQHVGESAFTETAMQAAAVQVRNRLPLRAEIDVVGYLGRKPNPEGLGLVTRPAAGIDGNDDGEAAHHTKGDQDGKCQ